MKKDSHRGGRVAVYTLAGLLLPWSASFTAQAVVDAHSRANTNAPPDGSPWDHVGTVNGASGIYLANGWVLTAAHVGAGNINLNGITYSSDANSQQLTNADGTLTDLVLFHLTRPPPLAPLPLASATPAPNSLVDLIGFGYISGSDQTTLGPYTGFQWSTAQLKSWGDNLVDPGGLTVINAGLGDVTAFTTTFTAPGPLQTANESQAAPGDSGGGVFHLANSGWQLAGMLDAVSTLPNQPAGTSVYGDLTYAADIATYRNQILSVMATTAPVLTITRSGPNVLVCWPDTGLAYALQTASNLLAPNWTPAPQPQVAANGEICVSVPAGGGSAFFRLQLVGP